jgi:hypothetical protein
MSCLENMGRTLGSASIKVILTRPAISGYHCRMGSVTASKDEWNETHVGKILSKEVVKLSSVLDSSRSSTDNDLGRIVSASLQPTGNGHVQRTRDGQSQTRAVQQSWQSRYLRLEVSLEFLGR